MNETNATERYQELVDRREKMLEEMRTMQQEVFAEVMGGVFEQNPALVSFSWTQYTPYFNDGEPCVFGVNSDYLGVVLTEPFTDFTENSSSWYGNETENEDGHYEYEDGLPTYYSESAKEIQANISNSIRLFDESELQSMFGDGVRVTVTKDGVTVDDYDHD